MKYFYVDAEADGDTGDNSIINWTLHPPIVRKLHCELDFWPADALLEIYPCWVATVPMMNAISSAGLTGATFDQVEVNAVEQLRDLEPDLVLPQFVWLKIHGVAGRHDFGLSETLRLVVSERALKILQDIGIPHAKIEACAPRSEEDSTT